MEAQMLAVQFTTKMHKNTIKVPKAYKRFNENTVQVILMKEEKTECSLAKFVGKIRLQEGPLRYQRRKRSEWE
jgi:hypothetical protein